MDFGGFKRIFADLSVFVDFLLKNCILYSGLSREIPEVIAVVATILKVLVNKLYKC
jgi:hypothetical protein